MKRRPYPTDATRPRRYADPIRAAYYAASRARRFARRLLGH